MRSFIKIFIKIFKILAIAALLGMVSNCSRLWQPRPSYHRHRISEFNKSSHKDPINKNIIHSYAKNSNSNIDPKPSNIKKSENNKSGIFSIFKKKSDPEQPSPAGKLEILQRLAKVNQDPIAMFQLGKIYFNGSELAEPDLAAAQQWFKLAADQGLSKAMFELGNMAKNGLSSTNDITTAISWYEKAAKLGNIKAMLALGKIYCGEEGAAIDYNKALNHYAKAASMGSLEAEYQLAKLIENKLVASNKYSGKLISFYDAISKAAALGDMQATLMLADYYASNNNIQLALKYYQQAIDKNFAPAALRLGLIYLNGELVAKDPVKACKLLQQAADLEEAAAYYYLAEIYKAGLLDKADLTKAAKLYTKAVQKNFTKAFVALANCYFLGQGVAPDLNSAMELYQKAAQAGDSYSCFMLSIFYTQGSILKPDLKTSVYWYDLGMQQPQQSFAKFDIARLYETGIGFKKNYAEMLRWLLAAAESGLVKAQIKLGDLYSSTTLGEADYSKAVFWYQQAANQGSSQAQYSLAILLSNNPSLKIYRPSVAYNLMKKAALNGYHPAQYNLGLMYLNGMGTNSNPIKAYCWFSIALSEYAGLESDPVAIFEIINKLDFKAREKAVLLEQHYREKLRTLDNKQLNNNNQQF